MMLHTSMQGEGMQVTYKGKKHQITCDRDMPFFTRGDDGGCGQCIPACKSCILNHLGSDINKGWDDEANIEYDMRLTIGSDSVNL
jgi:hypothetical protein